ncbi:MaoC/PaaZ C-terminal domain-containing protein [Pseudomonas sp. N040]|uniref:MaoC/PaaZ C-terminal domain-containing protein n=1 Tax=Pseudomonas sp. N040 TaxID=2785325 RepID=UPI0018A2CD50|nr:MaoC/PaaZ C-terminal domain-containing protein [Pseudomonas sp. N040]MBF7731232.1 acyl dehydratase [Pseudomonas sp. N040]MBW7014875.1 dehydratase [Pseudomonas sp. N040]
MLYFEDLNQAALVIRGSYTLREEEIIAFARQWDPQPFHIDPAAAALSPLQGLFASSVHTYAITSKLLSQLEPPIAAIAGIKHELEMPEPARPGDILSLQIVLLDKRVSASKPDRGLVSLASELHNQAGNVVLRVRSLIMVKRRPAPHGAPA